VSAGPVEISTPRKNASSTSLLAWDSEAATVMQPDTPRSARKMGTAHKNASSWCIDSMHTKGRASLSTTPWATSSGAAAAPYGTD